MSKIRDRVQMIRLFFRLVFEMIRNYPHLNEDTDNNFQICKKICNKIIRSANIHLNIWGRENIPEEEKFLLISNHRCFFDVVFLLASVEQTVSFVAAKELWKYPILRKYLSSIHCVALDRFAQDRSQLKKSILSMKTALESGNVVLFPEGECSYQDYHMRRFKKGGFLGLPSEKQRIVPAFLQMGVIKNIGRWMIPQGDVSVYFGEPFMPIDISFKRKTAGEVAVYAQHRIETLRDQACGERKK